jgi:outer membrane immunogenic protein
VGCLQPSKGLNVRRLLLSSTFLMLAGVSAHAADMPYVEPMAASVAEARGWTGFYVGGNVGYVDADVDFNGPVASDLDDDGFIGGVQAGYNWQFNNIVLGLEADIQFADIDQSDEIVPGFVTYRSELNYLGTFRGRLGYAFGRVLPYVTGGLAYGENDFTVTLLDLSATSSEIHVGWTVGAGVEMALSDHLSAKIEYLYADLGDVDYEDTILNLGLEVQTARVGLNYRF